MQDKVKEAELKYNQIQEQLEGMAQRVQDLGHECSELKAEAQRRNTSLKSIEVSRLWPVYNILPLCYIGIGVITGFTVNSLVLTIAVTIENLFLIHQKIPCLII